MGKYIKTFESHTDYNTYINSQDKILSNVSYCEDNKDVHYNPKHDQRLIATFNVTDTTNPIYIISHEVESIDNYFTDIEIDGVVQPNVVTEYVFDTTGEHIVKYTLANKAEIGKEAFNDCTELTSVIIPNSVTSIGVYAFLDCENLTSVNSDVVGECILPKNIRIIDNGAFNSCTGLTTIRIPNGVTSINFGVFQTCVNLTNITIPDSVTSIGSWAFNNCVSLTSVTIPSSVTLINRSAFRNCTSLTSITIPSNVTFIGTYAFGQCRDLESITSLATVAPRIKNDTFSVIKPNGTLYVPSGSTGYDVWMNYLGVQGWTMVEQ